MKENLMMKGESYTTIREPLDKEMSGLPGWVEVVVALALTNALTNQAKS